jgi:hypothetical protein
MGAILARILCDILENYEAFQIRSYNGGESLDVDQYLNGRECLFRQLFFLNIKQHGCRTKFMFMFRFKGYSIKYWSQACEILY